MTSSLLILAAFITSDPVAPIESPIAFVANQDGFLTLDVDRLNRLAAESTKSFDLSSKSAPRPLLAAMAMPFLPGNIETTGPNLLRIARDDLSFTATVGEVLDPESQTLTMEVLLGSDRKSPEHSLEIRHDPDSTEITLFRHEELTSPIAEPQDLSWRVQIAITDGPSREVRIKSTRINVFSGKRENKSVIAPWSTIISLHRDILFSEVQPLFKEIGIRMPPFTDTTPTDGLN